MSAKGRSFRRRSSPDEGEDGGEDVAAAAAPPAPCAAPRAARPTVALSFGGEEDEEAAPALKPKKRLGAAAPAPSARPAAALVPSAGAYSRESLAELAAAQRTLPGPLRPSTMPPPPPPSLRAAGPQDAPPDAGFDRPSARPALPAAVARGVAALDEEEEDGGGIPDAEAIRRARERRERARHVHGRAGDYVPLSGGAGPEARAHAVPARSAAAGSDDEDEDEDVRLAFVGGAAEGKAKRHDARGDAHADDMEEEEERWASEQQRAAASVRGPTSVPPPRSAAFAPGGARAAAASAASAASAAAASMAALREGLARAQAAWHASSRELERSETAAAHSAGAVESLQEKLAHAGTRYRDVQELRDYIRDLCDCLKDKGALIEELEDVVLQQEEAAATARAERTAADAAAEAPPAEAAVAAATGALQRGAGEAAAAMAAQAAAAMAQAGAAEAGGSRVDEFGRDAGYSARADAARRAAARATRRAAAAARAPAGETPPDSSASSEGEAAALASGAAEAAAAARGVFADAGEEFATLAAVKGRLEGWKKAHPSAYAAAYAPLSVPALLAPFVRLELLTTWQPLRQPPGAASATHGAGFDHLDFFNQLFDYGMPLASPDDADAGLLPALVARVALPRVAAAAARCWEPARRGRSARLAAVLRELAALLPDDVAALAQLRADVAGKLGAAAAACAVPRWRGDAMSAAGQHASEQAARAAASATRLLQGISAFEGVLPPQQLRTAALDKVLGAQLLPHLAALVPFPTQWPAAARRVARIAHALPPAWLAAPQHPAVAALAQLCAGLAASMRADAAARGAGAAEAAARGAPQRLGEAMVRLGDSGGAAALAAAFPS